MRLILMGFIVGLVRRLAHDLKKARDLQREAGDSQDSST